MTAFGLPLLRTGSRMSYLPSNSRPVQRCRQTGAIGLCPPAKRRCRTELGGDDRLRIKGDDYYTPNGARQELIASKIVAAASSRQAYYAGTDCVVLRHQDQSHGLEGRLPHRFDVIGRSGQCAPCSRMETDLGPGGSTPDAAMAGIRARVIEAGV